MFSKVKKSRRYKIMFKNPLKYELFGSLYKKAKNRFQYTQVFHSIGSYAKLEFFMCVTRLIFPLRLSSEITPEMKRSPKIKLILKK